MNEDVSKQKDNDDGVLNVKFKMAEFKRALKKCKNTAPGKDLLCYQMFRNMSLNSKNFILKFFNLVWSSGSVPVSWRHAIVIPILKPNKVRTEAISYRPIALTSNMCKLMERMIVMRLNWYMEKNGLFNIHQSGFRKKRNTLDQLIRLSDDILRGIRWKKYVLFFFLI